MNNRWISEGNCLLKRTEKRFDVNTQDVPKIVSEILKTGLYTKERFFKTYESSIVTNVEFDIPRAKDMKVFGRKNYTGARLRTYYSPDKKNVSYTWGEWKTKNRNKTFKTRVCLNSNKTTIRFLKEIKKKGVVPVTELVYERSALNSKDKNIRITFDKNIHYFDMNGKDITNQTRAKKGQTKIKVKYIGKVPIKIYGCIRKWAIN